MALFCRNRRRRWIYMLNWRKCRALCSFWAIVINVNVYLNGPDLWFRLIGETDRTRDRDIYQFLPWLVGDVAVVMALLDALFDVVVLHLSNIWFVQPNGAIVFNQNRVPPPKESTPHTTTCRYIYVYVSHVCFIWNLLFLMSFDRILKKYERRVVAFSTFRRTAK